MAAQLHIPKPKHRINPTLSQERSQATFDPIKITHVFDTSVEQTNRRKYLEDLIENDPTNIFDNTYNHYLHRTERHTRALAKHVRLVELCRSLNIGVNENDNRSDILQGELVSSPEWHTLLNAVADDLPTSLHWVMFVPNILSLADEEQQKVWIEQCKNWKMIGCYAQTELGHGSNVRGIETTATFVAGEGKDNGDEDGHWIIHSPTLTSHKFWPGTLGRTCNHAMVIAQLIDGKGVNHGVHNFLVQTRSVEDHTLMPGVVCGDIGPKIGYNNMDNGFAKFDHVKIPRRNMLMRFSQVDSKGVYSKKTVSDAASKVAYITMMQVRSYIIIEASKHLRMGVTMAIRYSAVRRQGFKEQDGNSSTSKLEEHQIIDYKQQQHRLFPLLAAGYCFFFTGKKVLNDLKQIENGLMALSSAKSSASTSAESVITKTQVGDIHATTSSLKSFTTTIAADGIEDCRKSCGGHGFLASSGLPELICSYLQNPTVEGDNSMLPSPVTKILLKLVKDIQSGDEKMIKEWYTCDAKYLIEPVQQMLLSKGENTKCCYVSSRDELMNLDTLLQAYQHRSARLLVQVATQIQNNIMKKGKSFQDAWNGALIQMARVSRAHSLYLLLNNFVNGIKEESGKLIGQPEVDVLQDLALLFGLYWIEKESGEFLEDGYMSSKQLTWVREGVMIYMDKIRPNAVALADANDFSDFRLKSALGRNDGNVYEAIMESAKRDPLNATEPGPGYEEHLKRLIVGGVGMFTGTASRL